MTTEEAIELRRQLECDIFNLLKEFKDKTGFLPISIDVQSIRNLNLGKPSYAFLERVSVTVEI